MIILEKTKGIFVILSGFLKKRYRTIIKLSIFCLIIYTVCSWIVDYGLLNYWAFQVKKFGENKPYFELLAKNSYQCFKEEYNNNDKLRYIRMYPSIGQWDVLYAYDDGTKKEAERIITEEEQKSIDHVRESLHWKYNGFTQILVHQDRVTFITAYPFTVVWSRNGKKPEFLAWQESIYTVSYKKLSFPCSHWYHCEGRSD